MIGRTLAGSCDVQNDEHLGDPFYLDLQKVGVSNIVQEIDDEE